MIKSTEVRDRMNRIIGWCKDANTTIVATHYKKGYAGYYNKNANITFDKDGKVYAFGDATQSLIRDMDNE